MWEIAMLVLEGAWERLTVRSLDNVIHHGAGSVAHIGGYEARPFSPSRPGTGSLRSLVGAMMIKYGRY